MDGLPAHQQERIGFPRTRFFDSDELAAVYRAWGMDVIQLNAETGDSWTATGQLGDLRVWATSFTGRYGIRTGLPPGSALVQISSGQHGGRRVGGLELQRSDILAGFAGHEITGIVKQQHRGTSFVMPLHYVTDVGRACARVGSADARDLTVGCLQQPVPGRDDEPADRRCDVS